MPTKIHTNDGSVIISDRDMDVDSLSKAADLHEAGSPLPKGFTVQPPAVMQQMQAEQAPTPFQQLSQMAAGPAAAVRDRATQGIAQMLSTPVPQGVMGAGQPAAQQVQSAMQGPAQSVAQGVIPQTPGQAVSMLLTTALSGPAGPLMASTAGGVGGAVTRALLPAAGAMAAEMLVGDGTSMEEVLADVVPALLSEGAFGAFSKLVSPKWAKATRDKIGNSMTEFVGNELTKVSSYKSLRTPADFVKATESVLEKPWDTVYQRFIDKNIGTAQDGIKKAIVPSVAQLPPAQRDLALFALEDVAGKAPTMKHAVGAPLRSAPSVRVTPQHPDTVFEEAIQKVREARQAADKAEGAEAKALWDEYTALRGKMKSALSDVNPQLAAEYEAMNQQYAKDIDIRNFLWRMKKENSWETGRAGAQVNPDKLGKSFFTGLRLFDERGLFGGADEAMKALAGPVGTPGARPTLHEGYARLFQQMPLSAISASLAIRPELLMMPQGPVPSAAVRGASDMLSQIAARNASSLIGMGGPRE